MEKITMEQIDAVKNRANVGYKEAKEVLEKFDGDVVAAILYLEDKNKTKTKTNIKDDTNKYYEEGKSLIKKLNSIDVKIYKKDKTVLDIPSTVAIVITVFAPHITIGSVILSIVTGHKIKLNNLDGKEEKINSMLDKASTTVTEKIDKL